LTLFWKYVNISESGYSSQNGHTRVLKQALKYKPKRGKKQNDVPKVKMESPTLP